MNKVLAGVLGLFLVSVTAQAGVSGIRNNGSISGVPSYQVTCSSGNTVIIYKKNGTWYRGGSGHMGNKYNSLSKEDVANSLCD